MMKTVSQQLEIEKQQLAEMEAMANSGGLTPEQVQQRNALAAQASQVEKQLEALQGQLAQFGNHGIAAESLQIRIDGTKEIITDLEELVAKGEGEKPVDVKDGEGTVPATPTQPIQPQQTQPQQPVQPLPPNVPKAG